MDTVKPCRRRTWTRRLLCCRRRPRVGGPSRHLLPQVSTRLTRRARRLKPPPGRTVYLHLIQWQFSAKARRHPFSNTRRARQRPRPLRRAATQRWWCVHLTLRYRHIDLSPRLKGHRHRRWKLLHLRKFPRRTASQTKTDSRRQHIISRQRRGRPAAAWRCRGLL